MKQQIFFQSSLPRAGSTLLQNIEMASKNQSFIEEADKVESQLKKAPGQQFKDLWPDLYSKL